MGFRREIEFGSSGSSETALRDLRGKANVGGRMIAVVPCMVEWEKIPLLPWLAYQEPDKINLEH